VAVFVAGLAEMSDCLSPMKDERFREKEPQDTTAGLDFRFLFAIIASVEETGNGWRLHCLWALPGRWPFTAPPFSGTKKPSNRADTSAWRQLQHNLAKPILGLWAFS
jgi:hypothetical protein